MFNEMDRNSSKLLGDLYKELARYEELYSKHPTSYLSKEYKDRAAAELQTEGIPNPLAVFTHIPNPLN